MSEEQMVDVKEYISKREAELKAELNVEMALHIKNWLEHNLPQLLTLHVKEPLVNSNTVHGTDPSGKYEFTLVIRWRGKKEGVEEDDIANLFMYDIWAILTANDSRTYEFIYLNGMSQVVHPTAGNYSLTDYAAWRNILLTMKLGTA